ncbi:hypothetical protein NKG99_20425 [Mesorhizobium sp. M1409]|uniref:hypothetical protein n=1 Tax=Mesorhizobium sp. M1409 TaxID=2957100 RepID=UPI00333820DF
MPGLISVKDCISQASMEIGIAQRPITTAVASADQDIVQMLALLSAVADEVLLEQPYKVSLGDGVWVVDVDENPKPQGITSDSDLIAFDSRLAIDGVKYRFLKAKGLEFGEEMRDFLSRLNKLGARANAVVLDLELDEGRIT